MHIGLHNTSGKQSLLWHALPGTTSGLSRRYICVFCTRHQAGENYISGTYIPLDLLVLNIACVRFFFFSLALPGPWEFHLKSYLFVYLVFNEPSVYQYLVLLQRFRNNLVLLSTD